MRHALLCTTLALLLTACGAKELPPLPEGPQTATGTVMPADLSLVRRGTHQLIVEGTPLYFLESTSVDLRAFEGRTVGVQGTVGRNISPDDLAVFSVQTVTTAAPVQGKSVSIPALRVQLTVPLAWQQTLDGAATVLSASGAQVLLRIGPSPLASLPEDGVRLLLAGRKAARTFSVTGVEQLTVDAYGKLVLIESPPFAVGDPALVKEREAVLQSIVFTGASQASSSAASAGSSKAPAYCGGAAGILCPQGSVCIITDAKDNVGFCKKIAKSSEGVQ